MATEVLVPPLGQTVDTVTLVAWYRDDGQSVRQGEMLFAIETDKANLDIEAPASGVLCQVSAQPGDDVKVLSAIAIIAAPGEELQAGLPQPQQDAIVPDQARERRGTQTPMASDRVFISPRGRRLAEEHSIPLSALKPSGPEGAIVERDVRSYLDAQTGPGRSPVERAAVRAAADSTPHTVDTHQSTLITEADATPLVELRSRLAGRGIDVSYHTLALFVVGRALREYPQVKVALDRASSLVQRRVHVGLAVASDQGLTIPVVRDVDQKGLSRLENETHTLANRAAAGQCSAEELSGTAFAMVNLGTFGIDSSAPHGDLSAYTTLVVGRITPQEVFAHGQVVARKMMMKLSLCYDSRLLDDAHAERFVQRVRELTENPALLLA